MNRTSLAFLNDLFALNTIDGLNILIVNQTKKGNELISHKERIRVINSYDKGLSKSRNLALKNAIGDICLIADDDVQYVKNFDAIIKAAFLEFKNASALIFKIKLPSGGDYKHYPKCAMQLKKTNHIIGVSSIEIAFRRKDIVFGGITFNELFGLGSFFKSGEEFLFLNEVLKSGQKVFYKNEVIVKHPKDGSVVFGSDDYIKSQSAIYYILNRATYRLYIIKLIVHLHRKKIIPLSQFIKKYRIGIAAVTKYQEHNA